MQGINTLVWLPVQAAALHTQFVTSHPALLISERFIDNFSSAGCDMRDLLSLAALKVLCEPPPQVYTMASYVSGRQHVVNLALDRKSWRRTVSKQHTLSSPRR
jgi:hypothetical protein